MRRPIAILVLLLTATLFLWATTTGPNTPSTFGDTNEWASSGISDWQTSDDTRADSADCFDGDITKLTGFSFAIPDGEDIDGITVDIEASRDSGNPRDRAVIAQILHAGSTVGATRTTPILGTADVVHSLGGVADTWSAGSTESDVENSGFGVQVTGTASQSITSCLIDIVEITITSSASSTRNRFIEWGKVQHTQTRRAATMARRER